MLANSGAESWQALFKTGGALDLMIGCNPNADPKRTEAAAGDTRILVTVVEGRHVAVLYRPVSTVKEPAKFNSPWRTIEFDRVTEISDAVEFAQDNGNFEFSIPLELLGLQQLKPGMELKGDVGVLKGNGFQTLQRLYWQNKAASTVADVPTEATLYPGLWGIFEIR